MRISYLPKNKNEKKKLTEKYPPLRLKFDRTNALRNDVFISKNINFLAKIESNRNIPKKAS